MSNPTVFLHALHTLMHHIRPFVKRAGGTFVQDIVRGANVAPIMQTLGVTFAV